MSLINFQKQNLYRAKLDESVCKRAYGFVQINKSSYTEQTWGCKIKTSVNSTYNILNCKELHDLKLNILSHVHNFMYLRNYFFDGYIRGSWFNIYENSFYQEFHVHEDECIKCISGVLYLTENNSNIEFDVRERIPITPKFAEILLFDDNIPHRVCENNNAEERISLAFNYRKMNYWKSIDVRNIRQ